MEAGALPPHPRSLTNPVLPKEWCLVPDDDFWATKKWHHKVPLPRKTTYATRVALQHCPVLHMCKRSFMIPNDITNVNNLSDLIERQGGPIFP